MIIGKHLIAGQWIHGPNTFPSQPLAGKVLHFPNGSKQIVTQATAAAKDAFTTYSQTTSAQRADFLREIAKQLQFNAAEIIETCQHESNLPTGRLSGELGRTTGQLQMFAEHIEKGDYLERKLTEAQPDREPNPRPELRRIMRPFGPVAVFGASNFPLAFSTAGGDTASALAAGCPVIVKGHPAHPATSDLVAQAILAALDVCRLNKGVFSLIQDSGYETAQTLVTDPAIKAVGFTGSIKGGRALFDLCNQRPEPIPFYGEMGSVNPVFVLENSLEKSTESIAQGWTNSLNLGVGQFCTKPGLLIIPNNISGDKLVNTITELLQNTDANLMLTDPIAQAYQLGTQKICSTANVSTLVSTENSENKVYPHLYEVSAQDWMASPHLKEEVFGPMGIIIRTDNFSEMLNIASRLDGQLTATLHIDEEDYTNASKLIPILEQKAGRILSNGYPTGVEVVDAMIHGGPYPASTYMATTSVGSHAIQRFLKPVCYQNIPNSLLPIELQE